MDKMELTKTHIQKEVSTMSLIELFGAEKLFFS